MTCDDHLLYLAWGKAMPVEGAGAYHPAVLHMADVGFVAEALFRYCLSENTQRLLAGAGVDESTVGFIASLHDMGKLSPGFQSKVPELARHLRLAGLSFPSTAETDHAQVTLDVLPQMLQERTGLSDEVSFLVSASVGAHHGAFPADRDASEAKVGGEGWRRIRREALDVLYNTFGQPKLALGAVPDNLLVLLAGLTSVADWVGSDQEAFEYAPDSRLDDGYALFRRNQAVATCASFGLRTLPETEHCLDFEELFPFSPNAYQQAALQITEGAAPGMLVVEAPTGSGKTEAALAVAERWLAAGLGGVYLALPTQATSNQMFGRTCEYLSTRYPGERLNLQLLHSNRFFHEEFRQLRARSIHGQGGSVVADAWFASRKRGLLSPAAVGTVDQAMMGALRSRHFFVRLFGLAGKVVVVDEVHAYDTYMSTIIDRMLEWLRAVDAGVVLLSATLPRRRLSSLMTSYCGTSFEPTAYPRVTYTDGARPKTLPVVAPSNRSVSLSLTADSLEEAALDAADQIAAGGVAAVVCNTVQSAQDVYSALRAKGVAAAELLCFHSRFPLGDRVAIEHRLLKALSKGGVRPRRMIVVATQVIEQSLDIDFDLMVSELAPIDLLLQRMGRLHRHQRSGRPANVERPRLVIPAPQDIAAIEDLGPSRFVYAPHVLLRSRAVLENRSKVTSPRDTEELIEAVYGDLPACPQFIPEELWKSSHSELLQERADAGRRAALGLVASPNHRMGLFDSLGHTLDDDDDPTLHQDLRARTREIDPGITVICLHQDASGTVCAEKDGRPVDIESELVPQDVRELLLRSVEVRSWSWRKQLLSLPVPRGFQSAGPLRHARAASFHEGMAEVGGEKPLRLSSAVGLQL